MTASSAWLPRVRPAADAPRRVLALPYAGVGASVYHGWAAALAPCGIDFIPLQLPGRENRLSETAFDRMRPLVDALVRATEPLFDRPVALFGHSMGALVAYELARALRETGLGRFVRHLFVSAATPPHLVRNAFPLHALPEQEFLEQVSRRYGTLPKIVFESPELRSIVVPALRADLAIVETYEHEKGPALTCPLTVLGARRDPHVAPDLLPEWAAHTTSSCALHMFDGDHFFLKPKAEGIRELLQLS